MYERLLDKDLKPDFQELLDYCGDCKNLWQKLNDYIVEKYDAKVQIRFPYGNKYGWSVKYSRKAKHICDIFAEKGAFTVFMRIDNIACQSIEGELSDYSRKILKEKYPCGDGGWINYRITEQSHLEDIKRIIGVKVKLPKSKLKEK